MRLLDFIALSVAFSFLLPCEADQTPQNPSELIVTSKFAFDQNGVPKTDVSGNLSYLKNRFSPASTFKTYWALSLLENRVVDPKKKIRIFDEHIPGSPREVDLREALFYSSNDYFETLWPSLGRVALEITLRNLGYGPVLGIAHAGKKGRLPKDWWKGEKALKHGGGIRLLPEEIHSNWVSVFWKKPSRIDEGTYRLWREALSWSDCPEKKGKIFGKTGSWEGNYWFQGTFVPEDGGDYVAITILNKSKVASREKTILRFYEIVGCVMPSLN
ncbi:penicillin-binding transpeptidase domain-containing protein [Leptospira fluminis]|uniref:penicillin-binding transpeptidase domain-containing protein n=1 Tax=Leptospira fluminis TaxID=2484979 RepID=UPI001FEA225A|nr:penicillin-binding transpeptidase domain-containing protein [Leptospira fluminis]